MGPHQSLEFALVISRIVFVVGLVVAIAGRIRRFLFGMLPPQHATGTLERLVLLFGGRMRPLELRSLVRRRLLRHRRHVPLDQIDSAGHPLAGLTQEFLLFPAEDAHPNYLRYDAGKYKFRLLISF